MATHFRPLVIKEIRQETTDCISVLFDIPVQFTDEFRFVHGQSLTLRTRINNEEVRRSYSICSSPLENELRIAIKKLPGGKFSEFAHNALKIGDVLDVMPPSGSFYSSLHPSHQKNYIAFASGSGITPVISIIKATLATEKNSSFILVYGNKNRASIIFREELEGLKNKYLDRFTLHHILSREVTDAPINHGRIDREKCDILCKKLVPVHKAQEIFICGPATMIFQVREWLEEHGIDKQKLHFELFATPQEQSATFIPAIEEVKEKGLSSNVIVRSDGTAIHFTLPFTGQTILDAALQQGADLPYACKGGVCSTCRAKLVEGTVNMDTNYALEPEELEAGFILTCQSHPSSERVVIDFDVK